MLEKIRKNYVCVNIVFLLLTLYVIFFPIIANVISSNFPNLLKCPFLEITKKPCPLCGGTRYISNIYNCINDISYLFCPFGFMVIFVCLEFLFRIIVLVCFRSIKLNKNLFNNLVIIDLIVHVLAVFLFITYEIIYVINLY